MSSNARLDSILEAIQGRLIVSCQAPDGDPFDAAGCMSRFALAVVQGGAAGIRANSAENVRAIRQAVQVPIVGIDKQMMPDGRILITPTFEGARKLVDAGATIIAIDCTRRGQSYGAFERLTRIKRELNTMVVADIATLDEAVAAARAGADMVLSTMRGYTDETAHITEFDPMFISDMVRAVDVPVIAEGRIMTPYQARAAVEAGAVAVIVGTAITRPAHIARRFVKALKPKPSAADAKYVFAIDLGGTNTKAGVVSESGELLGETVTPTPTGGRAVLMEHLKQVIRRGLQSAAELKLPISAVGLATAGWVDIETGSIAYATDNLPGWTGTPVREILETEFEIPVSIENDADVLAHAERRFGAAKNVDNFLCITLGTGVGGGSYANGQLIRGANSFANAFGHLSIRPGGLPCNCGQTGCLEVYANAAALVRGAGDPALDTAEKVIAAANLGREDARRSIHACAVALADGCALMMHMLDPGLIILSGGLVQNSPQLAADLECLLSERVVAWGRRRLKVTVSTLGYHGGVLGGAALALQEGRVCPVAREVAS